MTLLVTGICGFAGSVIARELLAQSPGVTIVGLDNLCRRGSETNVEPLRALGIDVRIGDIRNEADLAVLPCADWVIDCAANPSVLAGVDGKTSAKELLDHNLSGTIHLLEYCRTHSAGFILLSTSRVYSIPPLASLSLQETPTRFVPDLTVGIADSSLSIVNLNQLAADPAKRERPGFPSTISNWQSAISLQVLSESFPTDPPISLYGSSKRCSELLALEYGMTFDFPVWINRCGVLAGAGQFGKADQGIFSYWIHSWKSGRPLKYIGFGETGKQVRDCLHPRDLVPLLLKQFTAGLKAGIADSSLPIADSSPTDIKNPTSTNQPPPETRHSPPATSDPSVFPNILNLSGGIANSMSLLELSMWCETRFGPHPTLATHHSPLAAYPSSSRPFDIPWMVLDPTLAAETWDWQPATPLTDILEEIARHAEANPTWLDMVT